MANLHTEVRHADGKGLHRCGDGLQIRPQAPGAHQLNAHLGGLVAAAGEVGPVAVDGLAVEEPQGPLPPLEAGGRHPGDGQGGVRPEHHQAAVVVGALVHLLLGDGRPRQVEHVEILQARGDDLPVAPQGKHLGELGLYLPAGAALLKKQVPGALWGDFAVCPHKKPVARPKAPQAGRPLSRNVIL